MEVDSLLDLVRARAAQHGERVVYRFVSDDLKTELSLTFDALLERVRDIGQALASSGAPGDRVVLMCPPGLDFIAAFFGCQFAQKIAVPECAPHPRRLAR